MSAYSEALTPHFHFNASLLKNSSLATQILQRGNQICFPSPSPAYFDVSRPLKLILIVKKKQPSNSSAGGSLPPTDKTTYLFCCFTLLAFVEGGGEVPKVDVKHVKCYLPYLLVPLNIHEV